MLSPTSSHDNKGRSSDAERLEPHTVWRVDQTGKGKNSEIRCPELTLYVVSPRLIRQAYYQFDCIQ